MGVPVVDYASLTANIIDVPNRAGDTEYAASTDMFIGLFEKSANRKILSRYAEMTSTLTTDADGLVTLPSDFIALRNSNVANGNLLTSLSMIPQGSVSQVFRVTTGGDPYYISISGNQLSANPPAVRDVTFDYYAKFVGLSVSNTTNWVILQHPDYYLWGTLKQAAIYLDDDRLIQKYEALRQAAEDEIMTLFSMEQYYGNTGMIMSGATP